MAPLNYFTVKVSPAPQDCELWMNGRPLAGVKRITVLFDAKEGSSIMVEFEGSQVEIDGRFARERFPSGLAGDEDPLGPARS